MRCPASLVITEPLAREAISSLMRRSTDDSLAGQNPGAAGLNATQPIKLAKETQWIAAYIILHWAMAGDDLASDTR